MNTGHDLFDQPEQAESNLSAVAHLVGGGIASLAGAVYLIRHGGLSAKNIHIYEQNDVKGGSLDGRGTAEDGYVVRGGRMFDLEAYSCTFDLLSLIPSLRDPQISLLEEFSAFNDKVKTCSHSRLIEKGEKIDAAKLGFHARHRLDLLELGMASEESLGNRTIADYFEPTFFETNFWFMWCTTFAFQPWHSVVEFKRYLLRFIQEFPRIHTLSGVRRTPYNQFDSIVLPIVKWLENQGVVFEMNCEVVNVDFVEHTQLTTARRLQLLRAGAPGFVEVNEGDLVFLTIGSMTADATLGSMNAAPKLEMHKYGSAWRLWDRLSRVRPEFGRPSAFDRQIDKSKWESFTITFRDPLFFKLMERFTGNAAGTGGLVTIKDSNWLMSVVLAYQPHFIDQPPGITVCWGYGLFPDQLGNFVHKKMSDCTGEEIIRELCGHLRFNAELPQILLSATCIPCMMPYITSQFLPRMKGDRPDVVPRGSTNLAFVGQFCEIPDDVVFTVEYSVRSAQIAVYTLLDLDRQVTPLYKGQHDIDVLLQTAKTLMS